MVRVDLFLLGGSYQAVEDGVVIELYGKTPAGEALVARYYGFRPYFVLTEPTEETLGRLRSDPEVVDISALRTWVAGKDHDAMRVTIRSPWKVPEYRERYRKPTEEDSVLACDIPFVHRFLYDKGLGLTVQFDAEDDDPEVAKRYTVSRVVKVLHDDARDIHPAEPFRPPLTVLSFDIENAIKERTIFTICGVVARGDGSRKTFRFGFPEERKILEGFVGVIADEDPDVITGYNIGGYDLPLLEERAKALGMSELPLGRDHLPMRDAGERLWRISGRIVADAWWSARRDLRPKQESLQFVARTLLGDTKLDVDRRNIASEWAKDPERVMEYCEHDADLALRILQRLRTVERAADLATVAHLPLEEGLNGRTSQYIDALLVPLADRRQIGVPMTRRVRRDNPIEGGYVHAIRPGIYRWVVVLDFKSMYPSIIIAKNICFTTLSDSGATLSPSGARFVTPDVRQGIVPEILRSLLADRDRFRALSRSAETPELREYYDGLQNAVKILMNSFYGVLASTFYRFTNKDIGAAITAFARDAITSIIRTLESDGLEVVYSDTDSVFVRSPTPTLEGSKEVGESISKRFTAAGVTFEFQSVYESFFSHGAKKRYVGRTAWPKEEQVVRGYETRRTDAFDFQSEALLAVFDLVLSGDTDGAVTKARELVLQCREGRVPIERLVIARSVRAEEQYNESTRDALPFLRVFRRLKEEGYDVIPGMKVAWIVTDARKSPQEIEPWVDGRPFSAKPDFSYYADRVAQTLARVTEVFDWDAAALLRGSHQQRLGAAEPPASPVSSDGATLDSPVADLGKPRKHRQRTFE
ncbi:MAG: DNA polymerase II [Thermoplasmata archaeon]|nr:DNA polymerase II [Thermoplasmata archaeon]